MALIVVSDNSPLSSLAIVGYLSLLQQLYEYMLKQCLDLFDREAAAKKAVRDAQTALEEAVFAQYSKLTEVENQNVGGG